jgi:hypothetical protein
VADSPKVARSVDKLFVRGVPLQSAKSPKPANGSQNWRG